MATDANSMVAALGDAKSWKRRARSFFASHLRQVPCLYAALPALACFKCCKSRNYQTLGQDEEGDNGGAEDHRQKFNQTFGLVASRTAVLCAVGITVKLITTNPGFQPAGADGRREPDTYDNPVDEFKRDSPLVLYMAVIELLACGACALTASSMYTRRRHQLVHPAESDEKVKRCYLEVHLSKEACVEEMPTYGIGFRPSTDGLECLLVESIRWGSLLDDWNRRQLAPTPEELVEEAFGISAPAVNENHVAVSVAAEGAAAADTREFAQHWSGRRTKQVDAGSAIVAVNDVAGDVGMMQLQLLKPRVTLWIRDILSHASQFEDGFAMQEGAGAGNPSGMPEADDRGLRDASHADSTVIGQPAIGSSASPDGDRIAQGVNASTVGMHGGRSIFSLANILHPPTKGPVCACVGMEDEEPQILTRWLTCSLLFGWVTMLPVLFMQPHDERPRQHLFRQFLLKPCLIIMPLWILLWFLDCIQMAIEVKLIHPFYYFGIVHMIMPGILVWYLMQMQASDERTVLEQRAARSKEVEARMLMAVEDPSPTFLKELIMMNPVALVWLGACVSIPIVACSFLTPMTTERGRMAQGFINIIYSPMVFIQCAFAYTLWRASFEKLPQLYMAGFATLLSVPCFMIWCVCIVCSSRYGRRDLALVQEQRVSRAKLAKEQLQGSSETADASNEDATKNEADLVDCTEAQNREWELIYTA